MAMQAQVAVPNQSRSIENMKLILNKRIKIQANSICGCSMMPDGKIAITCDKCIVRVFNTKGNQHSENQMTDNVFDLVNTSEDDTYAVTTGSARHPSIIILSLRSGRYKKMIFMDSYTSGISLRENRLIYSCCSGIRMLNPYDESIYISDSIVLDKMTPRHCYVATFEDKVYHSCWDINTVTCYDLQGKPQWTFQNESVLKKPRGIDVDHDGNVYVVGNRSNNVVVISPDGQRHREVLTVRDGIIEPTSLHFNGPTKQLLVANYQKMVTLFDFH